MKLPNAEQAVVAEDKIVRYLLNEAHPRGKDKAAFFSKFGFSVAEWEMLVASLLAHAAAHEVVSMLETPEGTHYAVDGPLSTPDGRSPQVRSIWAVDTGSDTPRLITAYPLKPRGMRMTIREFDQVALSIDLPAYGLEAGDVGTVVDITPNGKQLTLEFFNFEGETVAVVPVSPEQVRPLASREVMHARPLIQPNRG